MPSPDIIVNVQGDEPEIAPELIDALVAAMQRDPAAVMGTVASPFADDEDPANPHIVKVVCDQHGRALYFSRALIPYHRAPGNPAPGIAPGNMPGVALGAGTSSPLSLRERAGVRASAQTP